MSFALQTEDDYLALGIFGGKVEFRYFRLVAQLVVTLFMIIYAHRFDLGTGIGLVSTTVDINDGVAHTVSVFR